MVLKSSAFKAIFCDRMKHVIVWKKIAEPRMISTSKIAKIGRLVVQGREVGVRTYPMQLALVIL